MHQTIKLDNSQISGADGENIRVLSKERTIKNKN
jgi:hypothetical protein